MNNCLVTKLKSTVNNEGLSKLNVLTIKTKTIDSPTVNTQRFRVEAYKMSVLVNSESVGVYKTGISGELLPYPYTVFPDAPNALEKNIENKDGTIEITGKYNIKEIIVGNCGTVRMKEIYGIPNLSRIVIKNIEEGDIDISRLFDPARRSKFTEINLPDVNFVNKLSKNTIREFSSIENIIDSVGLLFDDYLSIDDLADNVNIKEIVNQYMKAGNVSSLAKLTKLQTIQFISDAQNNGDIMDFINPWIQAGRTSGKIQVYWLLAQKNITLNGQPITYPSGVVDGGAYLNWTSDGTVTFTAS